MFFGVFLLVSLLLVEFLGLFFEVKLALVSLWSPSRPEFDPLPALASEVNPTDSTTDPRKEYLRLLCLHFQAEKLLSMPDESNTVENLYPGIFCSPFGLEISVLCLPKLLQSSSTYLEDMTAVHSKNCQVIVLTPEGLSNSITRADLKPTKRKHKTSHFCTLVVHLVVPSF